MMIFRAAADSVDGKVGSYEFHFGAVDVAYGPWLALFGGVAEVLVMLCGALFADIWSCFVGDDQLKALMALVVRGDASRVREAIMIVFCCSVADDAVCCAGAGV